ncbi:hypothetical protein PRZ48_006762 [Zasmidium cellare]|uniref:Hydrolase n=1 Tax=Zasmidium cellare TaxID=395010 RepID=A0ABR0EHG4_ZASCE|nr:hypothetical protein PRZ48_006762 [Zasmidium cellare]
MGPRLAERYTVIAPDNRAADGEDLLAILDFLNISSTNILAHEKGVGLAASLAVEHPERVNKAVIAEYPLPGFGYDTAVISPNPYDNWELAFFAVPDVAQYFVQGRERQMLEWYFWHGSYSGGDVISNDLLEIYTRAISKPGFLRAMFQYFAAAFEDSEYFTAKINATGKLSMPVLALGGEASFAPEALLQTALSPVASDLQVDVVPKAGHWIPDENPQWFAQRAMQFFGNDSSLSALDLSALDNATTVFGVFYTGLVTAGTNTTPSIRTWRRLG